MVIAETPRLLLREFSSEDVGTLAEIIGDPKVMEFSTNGPCTEDDTRQFIDWCLDSYRLLLIVFLGRLLVFAG